MTGTFLGSHCFNLACLGPEPMPPIIMPDAHLFIEDPSPQKIAFRGFLGQLGEPHMHVSFSGLLCKTGKRSFNEDNLVGCLWSGTCT